MAHSCDAAEESPTHILSPEGISPTPHREEVPREYFIQSLRALAPNYWEKPETSDCTIIVPIPQVPGGPLHKTVAGPHPPQTHTTTITLNDPSGSGRRATELALHLSPRLRLQLHVDYLSTHSNYIRALLSGANPLDLVHTTMDAPDGARLDSRYSVPANRLPRLLSSPSNHPTLYLPVPDPSSFQLIAHWMYFGDTTHMEECLHKKIVHWEGLARNVEYLGVSSELKIFLKMWYYGEGICDSDEDFDTACNDSDYDSEDYDPTPASGDENDLESGNKKELPRGRPRIRRPLSYQEPGTMLWCN
ncbi:hypothetical protein C0995_007178 [Termitomyces sp. Mi166|nr:hypothetical protein C0995_007178 [Termitomyces sp. Mi166\